MTEQEAKYTIIEYKPIIGFKRYVEALDTSIKALEKQIPKQVKLYIGQDMQCPECNKRLRAYEGMKICYCKFCGQALER